jgi:hypothetical protein
MREWGKLVIQCTIPFTSLIGNGPAHENEGLAAGWANVAFANLLGDIAAEAVSNAQRQE